jgi:hypothetical protein
MFFIEYLPTFLSVLVSQMKLSPRILYLGIVFESLKNTLCDLQMWSLWA